MKWLLSALAIGTAHAADPASVPAPKVSAGDAWTYAGARSDGKSTTFKYELTRAAAGEIVSTVKGWEDIVVPAGKFRALRIEREEKIGVGSHDPRKNASVYWYVPELRWHAQVEIFDPAKNLRVTRKLQSYKVR
jgi:hypothetical protein